MTQENDRSDKELYYLAIRNLENVEKILTELGSTRQAMSVGPPLEDLQELKAAVCQRGRDYGIVGVSKSDMDIRVDAKEYFNDKDGDS